MSNELISAADEARRLLRGFKAFEEVAQALELAGTAVQAHAEANAAIDALKPQIEAAKAELVKIKSATKAEHDKAQKTIEAATRQSDLVVKEAQSKAEDCLAAARLTLANAKVEADELTAAAADVLERANEARDAVAAETEQLQAKLDTLKAQAAVLLGA